MSAELASVFLRKMLTDPLLKEKLPVYLLTDIAKKNYGLTRADLKAARKDIGVISEKIDGVWFWSLPEVEK